jgi:rare lipoprotein A
MLSACGSAPSKRGGYYLDDGPGANPPANLDTVADAVPRDEPVNRYTTRPYTAGVQAGTESVTTARRPPRARSTTCTR